MLESVLGKKIPPNDGIYACSIALEDNIEFARRIGMDAVVIDFIWRSNNIIKESSDGSPIYIDGSIKSWEDLDNLEKLSNSIISTIKPKNYLAMARTVVNYKWAVLSLYAL